MQLDNLRNLSRVVFTHRKHIQFSVNVFWYCFPVIKQYNFHYLMKSAPIPGNQSSFETLQLCGTLIFFYKHNYKHTYGKKCEK